MSHEKNKTSDPQDPMMTVEQTEVDERAQRALEQLRRQADAQTAPSGTLIEAAAIADALDAFDGSADAPASDALQWIDAWDLILESQLGDGGATKGDVRAQADAVCADGAMPIFIADWVYERARPRWEAHLRRVVKDEAGDSARPALSTLIKRGEALFAAALPATEFDLFTPVLGKQYGLETTFVVPDDGYRTNTERTVRSLTLDFGDGATQPIRVGEAVSHTYETTGVKTLALSVETSDGTTRIARFTVEVAAVAPPPGAIWKLGNGALDRAYVYYGLVGGRPRTQLEKPILLADGFPGGRGINQLWPMVNQANMVQMLRAQGKDVVIIGFQDGSKSIQSSADQYIRCLERAISEKNNQEKIAAGGASMGGLVARYALCKLEKQNKDHHVGVFYTVDTPHFGANIPVSVQAFVQLYASHNSSTSESARLMASAAAQQMLLQWIPPRNQWRNGGRYPIASPERGKFLADLHANGWMPQGVARRAGVANGVGSGVGNGVKPGGESFWFECTMFAWATMWAARMHPSKIVSMNRGFDGWDWNAGLEEIDGAPGGIRSSWREVHDGVGGSVRRNLTQPDHCFVPSTSACAVGGNLYTPVNGRPSELHAFKTSSTVNLGHVVVTPELRDFLIAEITNHA